MSIENLKAAMPAYARDQKLNVGSLRRNSTLNDQQFWGCMLACAAASSNSALLKEIAEEAAEILSAEAVDAAYGAATVMAMNNVAYRAQHWLGDDYANIKFGLRMNIIAKPGVEKADFELWSFAVSAINGCEQCLRAHEKVVREAGVTKEQVWDAVKIAGTLKAVAQALSIEETLSE